MTSPRRTVTLIGSIRRRVMPELPEVEAWRRQLDADVKRSPIEQAGPAHIATLKTFDPPLSALEGEGLAGARRRAKRLYFPTDDGELVVLVHLMTAGRLRYVPAGGKGRRHRRSGFGSPTAASSCSPRPGSASAPACGSCARMRSRRSSRISGPRPTRSTRPRSRRSSARTRGGSTRCCATSG